MKPPPGARFASGARLVERRHAQAFPLRTRWWIVTTRWADVSWRLRWQDLVYLICG